MKILVIVDVQKQFDEYIQYDLIDELSKYAESFDKVYQIWDTHNNVVGPSESFPNQVDSIPKRFGKNHFSKNVKDFITKMQNSTEEGDVFSLKNDEGYIVRVENNHDWFYVNPEIFDLIEDTKEHEIILAGGALGECIEDVYQAFLAFGANAKINNKYTYSAKTTEDDSIENTQGEWKKSVFEGKILRFNEFKIGKK